MLLMYNCYFLNRVVNLSNLFEFGGGVVKNKNMNQYCWNICFMAGYNAEMEENE